METNNEKKHEGYFGYYIFVFISAIIGFIFVFFSTRLFIDEVKVVGATNLVPHKLLISIATSLVAVIIFMFISLVCKKFLKKLFLSEIFLYIYIGFLTTVINVVSFKVLNDALNQGGGENTLGWMVAEVLAFIVAVIFAFFADKLVVFKSYNFIPTKIFAELGLFISARLITEGINIFLMYVIINVLKQEVMTGKIIASVVIIVLNYLFSKFVIFKKIKKVEVKSEVDDETKNEMKEELNDIKLVELNEAIDSAIINDEINEKNENKVVDENPTI